MKVTPINTTNPTVKNPSFNANFHITKKAGAILADNIVNVVKKNNIPPAEGYAFSRHIDTQLSILGENLKIVKPFDYNVTLDASQAYKKYEAIHGSGKGFDNEAQGDLELYFEGSPRHASFTYNLALAAEQAERLFYVIVDRIQNP